MGRIVGGTDLWTGNRVRVEGGVEAQLCCAADILLTGLYQDVEGEAICPVCGAKVNIAVRGRAVARLAPAGASLHYVRFTTNDPRMFGVVCESTFMFDNNDCLEKWSASYIGPPGRVATPGEFLNEVCTAKGLSRNSETVR